jgi:hypothetical protein
MKIILSASLVLALGISKIAAADILCQRKKEKKPSAASVLNMKIVKGKSCPAGFTKVGDLVSEEEISSLVAQQVNSQLTTLASVGPQGGSGS